MTSLICNCQDTSDVVPLFPLLSLYLKPVSIVSITAHVSSKGNQPNSSNAIMDEIKKLANPKYIVHIRIVKCTLQCYRFEAEVPNKKLISLIVSRLDGKRVTLANNKSVTFKSAPSKPNFPSPNDWDTFFRDTKTMNEMKPGERPDTIYISHVPKQWFSEAYDEPNERLVLEAFQQFGEVSNVDIPINDPYRSHMKSHLSGMKMFSDGNGRLFEMYIQFKDYVSFATAMDVFRGKKLLYKAKDREYYAIQIKVDFDKSKHLSDASIRKRAIEREKIMALERENDFKSLDFEEDHHVIKLKKSCSEENKKERRQGREGKRKELHLQKLAHSDDVEELDNKIQSEEHLLLVAQRKLEAVRLLTELFNRLKETSRGQERLMEDPPSMGGCHYSQDCMGPGSRSLQGDSYYQSSYQYWRHLRHGRRAWHGRPKRGFGRGTSRGHFPRKPFRGHGWNPFYRQRHSNFIPAEIYYGATHDLYCRYFEKLSHDPNSRSRSCSRSRSRSCSKSRSNESLSSRRSNSKHSTPRNSSAKSKSSSTNQSR